MSRTTARALLMTSASALTMAAFGAHAQSVTAIPGGGSSLAAVDYAGPLVPAAIPTPPSEFYTWNAVVGVGYTPPDQLQYFDASSGRGQNAFATDNPANFAYTGPTPLPSYVAFAASDAFLAAPGPYPETINGFTYNSATSVTYPLLSTQDGALIQLPMLGLGITIPAASGNAAVKTNGTLQLTDNDVCGIFAGTLTDYSNITTPLSGLAGTINVYYRSDSSGTTFLLSNHLKLACANNSTFTATQLALMPTTSFASLFNVGGSNPNLPTLPTTFHGESGSAGVAETLAGTVKTSGGSKINNPGDPSGIGYLSTDYTAISTTGLQNATAATAPDTGFVNTKKLFTSKVGGFVPNVTNITAGLAHPGAGAVDVKPPVGAAAANPLNWIPSIPLVTAGYPIVGYTNFILAQCYSNANVASGLTSFLTDHFSGQSAYKSTVARNGFTLPVNNIDQAVIKTFLTGSSSLAIGTAGTAGTCASVSGR